MTFFILIKGNYRNDESGVTNGRMASFVDLLGSPGSEFVFFFYKVSYAKKKKKTFNVEYVLLQGLDSNLLLKCIHLINSRTTDQYWLIFYDMISGGSLHLCGHPKT